MQFPEEINTILLSLARIPYENLSKIVAYHKAETLESALDTPDKMYRKSMESGAGGTCFSLTFYLKDLLHQKGFSSEFIMGDKYTYSNIHCGLLFDWEGVPYLLDPGYMIFTPMQLPEKGLTLHYALEPNAVSLEDRPLEDVWRLYTGRSPQLKMRFDFRKKPVSHDEFLAYWRDTFFFNMMEYPVLNKVDGNVQYYLQKKTFLTRTKEGSEVREVTQAQFEHLAESVFGISDELINQALEIILKKERPLFLS
ncbi:MAG: arylamine N-acetyltransferase [Fibrobacteria bacterium]|nr:arylamine N-acetyltransferase [Fibrobacteria bacterium]